MKSDEALSEELASPHKPACDLLFSTPPHSRATTQRPACGGRGANRGCWRPCASEPPCSPKLDAGTSGARGIRLRSPLQRGSGHRRKSRAAGRRVEADSAFGVSWREVGSRRRCHSPTAHLVVTHDAGFSMKTSQ